MTRKLKKYSIKGETRPVSQAEFDEVLKVLLNTHLEKGKKIDFSLKLYIIAKYFSAV